MKKKRSLLALVLAGMLLLSSCSGGGNDSSADIGSSGGGSTSSATSTDTGDASSGTATDTGNAPEEGQDTNNGRPYNLAPVKYDSRKDEYLNGINGTVLPVTDEPVTIDIWRSFSSTVMSGMDECEAMQEMEKRTNVKINWIYPPVGNEADNFTLRISSDDLPHIFSCPPVEYPGGVAKAVNDEIYADLTPYYEQGLMPNLKYLRETNEDYNRDLVDDEGRMLFFPMMDVVPSHPWTGLWVRKDWLDEANLDAPVTIEDWDEMLTAFKKLKGDGFVLAANIDKSYGTKTNYNFAASFEASFQTFLNKDGTIVYGSIEPGYKDYLTQMNKWYSEGILDPDFATRTDDDYNANVANGVVGAFGMNYGEIGQAKLTGQLLDEKWEVIPVQQPTSYDGQVIHLRQDNAIVRGDREYVTTRAVDEGIIETVVKYKDYWYSQDGGDLLSYGPEGVSYEWNDEGEVDWIYPDLVDNAESDFWTLFPKFKVHNYGYLRDSTAYEFEPEVYACIDEWAKTDASWVKPDNIAFTTDESKELSSIVVDVEAYVLESTFMFISGQKPISEFDSYVEQIKALNIERAVEIYQAALDRYYER